jgi:hypothetical protein
MVIRSDVGTMVIRSDKAKAPIGEIDRSRSVQGLHRTAARGAYHPRSTYGKARNRQGSKAEKRRARGLPTCSQKQRWPYRRFPCRMVDAILARMRSPLEDELCDGITCGGHLSWFPRGRDFPFATKFPGRSPKLPVRSAKFPDSNHKIPGSIFTGNFALTPGILAIFLALNGQ